MTIDFKVSKLIDINIVIKSIEEFNDQFRDEQIDNKCVVYILKGKDKKTKKDKLYIGESKNFYNRIKDHKKNKEFSEIFIINCGEFDKNNIYHIETLLIDYLNGEEIFEIENVKLGQEIPEYNSSEETLILFNKVWEKLIEIGIGKSVLGQIEQKFVFKYSPFKELDVSQKTVIDMLIESFAKRETKVVIEAEPGTGKSLVLSTLVYKMVKLDGISRDKIAVIIPQSSLIGTFRKHFRQLGLHGVKVVSPSEFIKSNKKYVYVFVDESHRLKRYFGKQAGSLKHLIDEDGSISNELELITKKSMHLVLFYDRYQGVRPADVPRLIFQELTKDFLSNNDLPLPKLDRQYRVKKGDGKELLKLFRKMVQIEDEHINSVDLLKDYQLDILDNIEELVEKISDNNKADSRSRLLAGYAWEWKSKKNSEEFDIVIGNTNLKWNSILKNWLYTDELSNEVGCIHTIQGNDLSYVGVIVGGELKLAANGKLYVDRDKYKDRNGKTIINEDIDNVELLNMVKDIYYVLLSRGINGCYIYVCDEALRSHWREVINLYK